MMRLESSKDMGDPREISCKSGTIDLKETQTHKHINRQKYTAHGYKLMGA